MADEMEDRAARISGNRKKRPNAMALVLVALLSGLGVGGVGVAYYLNLDPDTSGPVLDTSDSREFQRETNDGLTPVITPEPVLTQQDSGPSDAEQALLDRIADLEKTLEDARNVVAPEAVIEPVVDNTQIDALQVQLDALIAANKDRESEIADIRSERDDLIREATRKNAELEGLNLRLEQAANDELDALRRAQEEDANRRTEDERREELERRRAEAEAVLQAQINSSIDGLSGGANNRTAREYEGDDAFIRAGSDTIDATQSRVIGAPSNTVMQGTVIEATLTTGINSQLSGTITSTVSYDVWSFDMQQVLIPRGSQMFGRYSNEVALGQRRVLVAWDRVVTPNGQVVSLEAYGSDRLGRSGLTGNVNNRVGARFGAAAAISVFSALPALAAAQSNTESTAEAAEQIGADARDAANSVVEQYLTLAPIITVEHGDVIMVMVTNNLELF